MKKYTSNYFLEYCHFPKKYVWERKNEGKKISKRKNDKRKRSKKKHFNHYALLKKNAYCVLLSVSVCAIFFINLKHTFMSIFPENKCQ